jgi:hypothetical protein
MVLEFLLAHTTTSESTARHSTSILPPERSVPLMLLNALPSHLPTSNALHRSSPMCACHPPLARTPQCIPHPPFKSLIETKTEGACILLPVRKAKVFELMFNLGAGR